MTGRIDSHQHFWNYSKTEYPWIPEGSALHATWLPSDLEVIQRDLGFAGSIAVQARQCSEENQMLLGLADQYASVLGVVGWVNLRSERVEEELAKFSGHEKFVGVRHVAQDEPDDRFLVGSEFMRGVGELSTFGLRYDLLIYPKQLPAAIELVRHFPEQFFVLDHCAKPLIVSGTMEPWASQIKELAGAPNVFCKVSGLVTEANHTNWESGKLRPYFDIIVGAFGAERLMWGSDWPVCLLASSYERWLETTEAWIGDWSAEQRAAFFGGNARKFYGLKAE
jgi:L-fuconolactonase